MLQRTVNDTYTCILAIKVTLGHRKDDISKEVLL